jgi:hypothetical protein
MAHGILNMNMTRAMNVDSLLRSAVTASDDLDNGNVVNLLTQSSASGMGEVWLATKPLSSGTLLVNLWMVADPEVVVTYSGNSAYKGIDPDVQNFYVKGTNVFRAFMLSIGDIIELSADALGGTKNANGFVVATNNTYKLTWAASAISGVSLKLIGTSYISLASGAIDQQRVTMYKFEVVALA